MPATDPRIDAYIAKAAPFAQPILTHLRSLVHRALPECDEGIKWGMPHFMVAGKNVAGMSAFKAHCAFIVHGDGRQGEADGMSAYGKIASFRGFASGCRYRGEGQRCGAAGCPSRQRFKAEGQ